MKHNPLRVLYKRICADLSLTEEQSGKLAVILNDKITAVTHHKVLKNMRELGVKHQLHAIQEGEAEAKSELINMLEDLHFNVEHNNLAYTDTEVTHQIYALKVLDN